ncbi:hypothetical protein GH714_003419 [Hevea brasiliensis]|uniref:NOSIC domain-containing protein n=1 Tax=Hevea brasiliensis TaxID=3981 RepID=A0A6A6M9H3_HEVBR|nr:hypothetical protein GH714_003419 [Hevea brasiliensis]
MYKVDIVIIQAIGLLDDLDKELNTYAMRVRECYGWHFPDFAKIIQDNILYAKAVKLMGSSDNAIKLDFSKILLKEIEMELKEATMISMGTEVDIVIIQAIGLLDDLDKELNTYAMRVLEWYGWHFPKLAKIIQDNILYAKAVKLMGSSDNAIKLDFSKVEFDFNQVLTGPK